MPTATQNLRADRHGQPLFLFIKHELFVSPVEAAIFVFVIATPLKHNHIIGIAVDAVKLCCWEGNTSMLTGNVAAIVFVYDVTY